MSTNSLKKLLTSAFIFCAVLSSFLLASFLAWNDRAVSAGVVYTFTAFAFLLFLLSRFRKIKGLGVEAELWDEKQIEAAKLVEAMKKALAEISTFAIQISIRMGRWDSAMPKKDILVLLESNTKIMKDAGFTDPELHASRLPFFDFVKADLVRGALIEFNDIVKSKAAARHAQINAEHSQPIKVTEKYNKDIEQWRSILSEELDWSKLQNEGGVQLICDRTIQSLKNSTLLDNDERQRLLIKYRARFEEIAFINEKGGFRDSSLWLQDHS